MGISRTKNYDTSESDSVTSELFFLAFSPANQEECVGQGSRLLGAPGLEELESGKCVYQERCEAGVDRLHASLSTGALERLVINNYSHVLALETTPALETKTYIIQFSGTSD